MEDEDEDEEDDVVVLDVEMYPGADACTVALKSALLLFFEFGFISIEYVTTPL